MKDGVIGFPDPLLEIWGVLGDASLQPASVSFREALLSPMRVPLVWGILLSGLGCWLLIPRRNGRGRQFGSLVCCLGFVMFALQLRGWTGLSTHLLFWCLAAITLAAAVCTITSHNPVYCAIWFALALLGTASLYLLQGSQFLGVATVVVYAGAIVVTFLFVVMLAQPDGKAPYDRISWGIFPSAIAALAGAFLLGALVFSFSKLSAENHKTIHEALVSALDCPLKSVKLLHDPETNRHTLIIKVESAEERDRLRVVVAQDGFREALASQQFPFLEQGDFDVELIHEDVRNHNHVAHLGAYLFTRHLIAIEVAGTLLMVALVGAVAIVIQGKTSTEPVGGSS
ncbi:MAG: hypothetical protein CMJ81_00275 [Planctomycetaceae bacterium]|nr:hypothetical protein [Planctomycetaceae bacterium]MBP60371.1 hypothetical protein [Planctomycetaceae bacterium]